MKVSGMRELMHRHGGPLKLNIINVVSTLKYPYLPCLKQFHLPRVCHCGNCQNCAASCLNYCLDIQQEAQDVLWFSSCFSMGPSKQRKENAYVDRL